MDVVRWCIDTIHHSLYPTYALLLSSLNLTHGRKYESTSYLIFLYFLSRTKHRGYRISTDRLLQRDWNVTTQLIPTLYYLCVIPDCSEFESLHCSILLESYIICTHQEHKDIQKQLRKQHTYISPPPHPVHIPSQIRSSDSDSECYNPSPYAPYDSPKNPNLRLAISFSFPPFSSLSSFDSILFSCFSCRCSWSWRFRAWFCAPVDMCR